MSLQPATPLADLTEKEWSSQVYDLCRALSWRRYHTYRSTRSAAGFPDETLVRDRIVFLELKTEKGKLSDAQREWLTAIVKAGGEAYVARPHDLQQLAQVLGRRYRIATPLAEQTCEELGVSISPWNDDQEAA